MRTLQATATVPRPRSLTGTFGPIQIAVPRARLNTPDGETAEWKSKALRAYQRRTLTPRRIAYWIASKSSGHHSTAMYPLSRLSDRKLYLGPARWSSISNMSPALN